MKVTSQALPERTSMSLAVGITLFVSLTIAAGLFVVVAASSGHLSLKGRKMEKLVENVDERLNARGEVPQFLRRLDQR